MSERVNISDRVFRELRDEIVSGRLPRGTLQSIYELADRFSVSRTPVREAVLRLADTGLVVIERNRGLRVRGLTVADIRGIFEVRLLLEVPAAAHAAAHATEETDELLRRNLGDIDDAIATGNRTLFTTHDYALHDTILEVMGNQRLRSQVRQLRDATQAMDASTIDRTRGMHEIRSEHEPIVAAIRSRDTTAAARWMSDHLVRTGSLLMTQVAALSAEDVPEDWPAAVLTRLA